MNIINFWQFLTLLTGFLSPKVISYLQNPKWEPWKKWAVNIGFHALIALTFLGTSGHVSRDVIQNSQNFGMLLGQLVVYSTLSYLGIWKPQGVNTQGAASRKAALRSLGLSNPSPKSPSNTLRGDDADQSDRHTP